MPSGASVVIKFLGDDAQLQRTMSGIKTESKGLGGTFKAAGAGLKSMALPALAVGAALFTMAQKAGATADALLDMRDQTGVSSDKLQEMRYVADQAGVSQDFYANSVKEVIKAQDELTRGTGPTVDALEALDVATKNADGSMRSAETITDDVFASLSAIEDPTLRAALAQDVFKRKFEDVLPVIGLGTDALDGFKDAAHEAGVVQSTEALKAANEYRKGMERLEAAVQGVTNEGMNALIPVLVDDAIPALETLIDVGRNTADAFGWVQEKVQDTAPWFAELLLQLNPILGPLDRMKDLLNRGSGNLETFSEVAATSVRPIGDLAEANRNAASGVDTHRSAQEKLTAAIKTTADGVRKATDPAFALRDAQDKFADAQEKVNALEEAGLTHTSDYADASGDLINAQGDLNFAQEKFNDTGEEGVEMLHNLAIQAGLTEEAYRSFISLLDNGLPSVSVGGQSDTSDLFSGRGGVFTPDFQNPATADGGSSITVNVTGGINTTDPAEARRFAEDVQTELDRLNTEAGS